MIDAWCLMLEHLPDPPTKGGILRTPPFVEPFVLRTKALGHHPFARFSQWSPAVNSQQKLFCFLKCKSVRFGWRFTFYFSHSSPRATLISTQKQPRPNSRMAKGALKEAQNTQQRIGCFSNIALTVISSCLRGLWHRQRAREDFPELCGQCRHLQHFSSTSRPQDS